MLQLSRCSLLHMTQVNILQPSQPIQLQLQAGRDSLDVIFLAVLYVCVSVCRCNTPGHLLAATLLQGNGPACVFLPLFSTERQGCTLCSDRPASQGYTVVLSARLTKR